MCTTTLYFFFFFQAEDGIRDLTVTGVQTCALPISVRRPGSSLYDQIGTYDMTTDDTYFERGINLRHGFLTEYVVDEPEYIIRVPENLREVGVLMEPMSVAQKAIEQIGRASCRERV